MARIDLGFVPRPWQAEVFRRFKRFNAVVAHRVSGKTELVIAKLMDVPLLPPCAFGASERQIFWTVALPGGRPLVLTGLRLGTTRAVRGMVVGEMIIALSGLGAMLKASGAQFDIQRVLAVLMVIILVSLGSNVLVGALGRRFVGRRTVFVHEMN